MTYYNVLSEDTFLPGPAPIQHARFDNVEDAEKLAAALREQGIDAYVAAWREFA